MTSDEQFSIALLAGIPLESSRLKGNTLTLTTIPCAVVRTGNGFTVYRKARQC